VNVPDFVAVHAPGCRRGFGECSSIGFTDNSRLVAGIVYHNWNPDAAVIEISAASICRKWLTKKRLTEIFSYPFKQLNCQMCVARVSERNTRTRRIWRSLGADEHLIPRLRGRSEAEIIFTLTHEKWLSFENRMNYGKTQSANAA